jgi:tetratricopeptide (TPR) repeat protein
LQLAERIAGTMVPTVQMHVALLYENSTDVVQRQRAFDLAQQVVDGFGVNAVYTALAKGVVARGMLQHEKNEEAAALAADAKAALAQTPTMQAMVVPTHVDALTKSGRIEDATRAAQELIALYDKLGDAGYVEPIGRLSAALAFFAAGNAEEGAKQRDLAKKYAERRAERAPNEEARQRFISCVPEIVRTLAVA